MNTPKSTHRFSSTCSCCISRRTFLASAAAVGATALLPGEDAAAQGAPAKARPAGWAPIITARPRKATMAHKAPRQRSRSSPIADAISPVNSG